MGRDRSLDEFFGGGDADESESDADADPGAADGDADAEAAASADGPGAADGDADVDADGDDGADDESLPDADAVDPATPTHRWTPEGAACESCGTVVERRWVDDGAFVCDGCKEW